MRAAVAAGAGFINDVRALRAPGALEAAAALNVPVCLMHMQGEPRTMQETRNTVMWSPRCAIFSQDAWRRAEAAGIRRERIVIDPGFGFGKTARTQSRIVARSEGIRLLVQRL